MIRKEAVANGLTGQDAKYLGLIDEALQEIRIIHQQVARKRVEGRKVTARIDRNLKEIQTAINRVEATL